VGSGFSRIGPPEGGPHKWLSNPAETTHARYQLTGFDP